MSVSLGPTGLSYGGGTAKPLINKTIANSTNQRSGSGNDSGWTNLTSLNYTPAATGNLLRINVKCACGVATNNSSQNYMALGAKLRIGSTGLSIINQSDNSKHSGGARQWHRMDLTTVAEHTEILELTAWYTTTSTSQITIFVDTYATDITGTCSWNFGSHPWRSQRTSFEVLEFGKI